MRTRLDSHKFLKWWLNGCYRARASVYVCGYRCLILSSLLLSPSMWPPLPMSRFAVYYFCVQSANVARTILCGEIVNNVLSGCCMLCCIQHTGDHSGEHIYDLRFIYLLLSYQRQCRAICRLSLNMTVCDTGGNAAADDDHDEDDDDGTSKLKIYKLRFAMFECMHARARDSSLAICSKLSGVSWSR